MHPPKLSRLASLVALCVAVGIPAQAAVNPVPLLVTKDKVSSRTGVYQNGSGFTESGGGRTGQAGDYAANFPLVGSGPIHVADASIFNTAAAKDELTVAFWTKKYNIADGSAFWANSPSSPSTTRGAQAHVPWSNNNLYWDTAGCCNPDTRINAGIDTFPGYTGDISWWTNSWHHFAFTKKGAVKQIWVDGELFLEGSEAIPLPTDFTELFIGSDGARGGLYRGLIDDFSVFSTSLTDAQMKSLFGGASPGSLPASAGLLAHWDFNDYPSEGFFMSVSPTPNTTGASPNVIQVVHVNGTIPWEQNNVSLKLDGVTVPATFSKTGKTATLRYVSSTFLPIQSTHTATLTYPGANGPQTLEWQFMIGAYTKDTVANRVGTFFGGSSFTENMGGRSGAAGDFAANFPVVGSGPVYVADASFFNVGATNDQGTVAFWTKKYDTAAGSAFWANSPLSPGSRGFQAHVPWDNNNVYFDTAGCCNADTRISAHIDTFAGYTGDVGFWTNWHYIVFSKNGATKQIWIDGQLFLDGAEAGPLMTDFTDMFIGASSAGGGLYHGLIDDFAVFSTQLTDAQVASLAGGAAPTSLAASAGLVANWNFNDIPAQGMFTSFSPANESTNALPNLIRVLHLQGATPWDLSQVSLKLDGATVPASVTRANGRVTIEYVPTTLFAPGSTHTAALTFPGTSGPETRQWVFTVAPYTLDSVKKFVGSIGGAAKFSADMGGRTGAAGDYAIDFGRTQAGQFVRVADTSFLNEAAANDEIAIVGWQKLHSLANAAFFWATSPSSSGGGRGIGTFPWGNNNIYFDTAGCCDGALQRVSGALTDFPAYTGDTGWWTNWHHFVYQKKGSVKQVWIDGQLFIEGENTNPLPKDFSDSYIGFDVPDNARLQGLVDDFAVYGTALADTAITQLASGALPTALRASAKLLAYWNFNDAKSGGSVTRPPLSISRSGNQITLTFGGTLESAATIDGTWTPVQGAVSPHPASTSDARRFYRAKSN